MIGLNLPVMKASFHRCDVWDHKPFCTEVESAFAFAFCSIWQFAYYGYCAHG